MPEDRLTHLRTAAPAYWSRACNELSAADPVMARLIAKHPEVLRGSGSAFQTLLNAIVGQQISVAVADAVWARLTGLLVEVTPERVARRERDELRETGLSWRKVEYVQGVAAAFLEGRVDESIWPQHSDDEIRAELTALRGVGPWTADMVLIFHERRPDVLPLGDVGLVNAAARLYGWERADGDAKTDAAERRRLLAEHAERWRPWRTVATWYVWRELDAEPVIY